MKVTGEAAYISAKTGTKRDGSQWFILKFLDNHFDEFFSIFVEEELFNDMKSCPKNTPVVLTLNLTPGSKYFKMENVEIVN